MTAPRRNYASPHQQTCSHRIHSPPPHTVRPCRLSPTRLTRRHCLATHASVLRQLFVLDRARHRHVWRTHDLVVVGAALRQTRRWQRANYNESDDAEGKVLVGGRRRGSGSGWMVLRVHLWRRRR
ncbi:hypothetical protein AMAG_18845 [Allomyces macrogynus ATCC 38327]|uniref:Uncharacterized protein n=1 Tax=Allomyces macrogynus (strain ATCC 38327) TaxID=578462 RepID=A0A0L0SIG2_ALLM3|nr:hypothetical protein AMAG_18845 [Allomyces macrogynus ATCC 38327]|eukprot:KNE62311.1 hypothetical protein AMAG_18845 [Allomyces macrogynus ATCC 38327]